MVELTVASQDTACVLPPLSDKVSDFDRVKSLNLSSSRLVELGGAEVEQT